VVAPVGPRSLASAGAIEDDAVPRRVRQGDRAVPDLQRSVGSGRYRTGSSQRCSRPSRSSASQPRGAWRSSSAPVRRQHETGALRQGRDLAPFRDAADLPHVRLQIVYGFSANVIPELETVCRAARRAATGTPPQARTWAWPATSSEGSGSSMNSGELSASIRQRRTGFARGPGLVGVEHQACGGRSGRATARATLEILLGLGVSDLELEGGVALLKVDPPPGRGAHPCRDAG